MGENIQVRVYKMEVDRQQHELAALVYRNQWKGLIEHFESHK